ncbi:MAG: hypothetical protein A2Y17_01990 [Clostridiales bacterium GWF2_38_85]|nr:MAG: hypothetical protein A2Y17_01990 [Clostridiales bacterium GWF2_38_85]HBL85331.1 hypothetical protein [Clostridiales bacterium]
MTELKINEQIAFLRKQKGITQEELAQALGVTNQSVSKWESAVCCPDIQLLPDIATYFGVTVDELLGYKPADSFGSVYLSIKNLFQESPKDESFSIAFKLATFLHEGAMSRGYKQYIPWDSDKSYGLDSEPYKWGWSICSEPEGCTMHVGNGIFLSDQKYWQNIKSTDIRNIFSSLESLCDINALKVLYAIFELTVHDFDNSYVSIDEISTKCKLSAETVQKAIDMLPIEIKDDDCKTLYRLEGKCMHLSSLLLMLRVI